MSRRLLLGTGAMVLLMGTITGVGANVASAAPPPVVMSGTMSCHLSGVFNFGTPLTNGGVAQTTMSLRASLSGCVGAGTTTGGVTITSGTFTANPVVTATNNCGQILAGVPLPRLYGKVQWAATGGTAADTKLHFDNPYWYDNLGAGRLMLGLPATMKSGSYAQPGTTAVFARLLSNLYDWQLAGLCATGSGGLQTIYFGARQDSTVAKGGVVTFEAGV